MPERADHRSETIRAFIAMPLPAPVRRELALRQAGLKNAGIRAAWPAPATFHLTLHFLGDLPVDRMAMVHACMDRVRGRFPRMALSLGPLGVFPTRRHVRVIWAGVAGRENRKNRWQCLYQLLGRCLADHGLVPVPIKQWIPHITLARPKGRVSKRQLERFLHPSTDVHRGDLFPIETVHLFQSRLSPHGAVHTSLYHVPLGSV